MVRKTRWIELIRRYRGLSKYTSAGNGAARGLGQLLISKKLNSVALVRERTIPTERPPPVGEVSANFLRIEGCHVVSGTGPHGR